MINKVILVGNLGKDPEVRSTQSGRPVTTFSLATSRKWKDADGGPQEQTEWHNIVCFGRQAEIAGQYLTKGRQVFVEGRLQTRSWEDKETGKKMYRTEIVCNNFQMLGGRGGYEDAPREAAQFAAEPDMNDGPSDDDIPF
jgi:single-strand DNA-binding protein